MFVQHNRKHDEMAQVQLDEVSDVQIANEHVLLGLGVDRTVREEGEIHQPGTIHILLLL